MSRLDETFARLRKSKEKALALFLTAGFPRLDATVRNALACVDAGADIIELGMPFSDPLADGPVIQRSSSVALRNGMTLGRLFSQVREIRKRSDVPIVLMGYVNPILKYGINEFHSAATDAGVDGLIFPEVPVEAMNSIVPSRKRDNLAHIMLVSPTTPSERIARIDRASRGFVYCVSTTGVTGAATRQDNERYLMRVRRNVRRNPILVGFGISTRQDVSRVIRWSDGVIVGSALMKRMETGSSPRAIGNWIRGLKNSCNEQH